MTMKPNTSRQFAVRLAASTAVLLAPCMAFAQLASRAAFARSRQL